VLMKECLTSVTMRESTLLYYALRVNNSYLNNDPASMLFIKPLALKVNKLLQIILHVNTVALPSSFCPCV
jgi:hypothetical protein